MYQTDVHSDTDLILRNSSDLITKEQKKTPSKRMMS